MKKINNKQVETLKKTVIDGGYCIGCGACAAVKNSPFSIKLDSHAKYQAFLTSSEHPIDAPVLDVCPFADNSADEDTISTALFGKKSKYNDKIGHYLDIYAGYVKEKSFRENGSSGGMGSWILSELLSNSIVDHVIHVKPLENKNEKDVLFQYSISSSLQEINAGSKSRYYPIQLSEILKIVKKSSNTYAIVGIPCFIKSIRLLSNQDPVLKERIKICLGLVCGHLKSEHFAGMFSWQMGIHPKNLRAINFRTKLKGSRAVHYGVTVEGIDGTKKVKKTSPPINQVYGHNWGWGLFKYKACDYCDDVVAETADVTIGDAWLPQYMGDDQGTNIIIVRNPIIRNLINRAQQEGRLALDVLDEDQIIQSQKAGFSHRRDGLAYRLHKQDSKNLWRPQKRIRATDKHLSAKKRKIQDLRIVIAEKSHEAFQKALKKDSYQVFENELSDLITKYEKVYAPDLLEKVKRKIKKIFN